MATVQQVLDDIIVDCTRSLFSGFGIELEQIKAQHQAIELVGVIGFAGETMRGALGLALTPGVAAAGATSVGSQAGVDDWLAEATNQLLGRVKNKLLLWGVPISIALPMVLRGVEVRLSPRSGDALQSYSFLAGSDRVLVWLDLQVSGDIVLTAAPEKDSEAVDEGGMVLF
jgi:hypothetical protein